MKTSILTSLAWAVSLLSVPCTGLSGDNAKFISQEVPTTMSVGGTYRVKLKFQNTGSTPWRESGGVGSYRLGSQSPANNQTWRALNRVLLSPGEVIQPGGVKTFAFDVTAPETPGSYRFQWQMLLEGRRGYFGDKSRGIDITVKATRGVVFNYDGNHVSAMVVKGENLLRGTGGIYLIGSADGSDAQGRSVSSNGGRDGFMRSDDPGRVPPPAFKLSFARDGAYKLKFRAEVGPVPIDFATMSMPFDFRRDMADAFSFDGTRYRLQCTGRTDGWRNGSGARYSAIPQACEIRNTAGQLLGKVGVALTDQPTRWGEVTGAFGKVRVNITGSSHYRSLAFYNHFGTHNLELNFGRMRRSERAWVEGEIIVTPSR